MEIAVDSSWVFALILATWTLVTLAGHTLPWASSAAVTLVGAGAAIGVFASLAVHEIVRGLCVRACGVPVRRVSLFLFGGITDAERDPGSPRSEIVAAVAAPLANAILGGVLLAGVAAWNDAPSGDVDSMLALVVRWVGDANLALAAVNMVPAFPLDAGRLARAVVWRSTGDVERATRWTAWAGQAFGWAAVAGGVVLAFVSHGDRVALAMWIALSGWFLTSAAAQGYAGVVEARNAPREARWHREALES
jgi:Zn-dependent protease